MKARLCRAFLLNISFAEQDDINDSFNLRYLGMSKQYFDVFIK